MNSTLSRSQSLLDALERFVAADPIERGYVERMRALLLETPAAFSRDQYLPGHFTASAFVLSPERRAVLLIWHTKLALWLQPGGHVEQSDHSMLHAARREATEESGIAELQPLDAGIFDIDIHRIPRIGGAPEHEHFDVRFLFAAPSTHHRAGSDAGAARWVQLDEIAQVASDRSVTRAIEKLRQMELA